jgi:hypothetical protein
VAGTILSGAVFDQAKIEAMGSKKFLINNLML